MEVGRYDFLPKSSQEMYRLPNSKGYDGSCYEVSGAHCKTAWRNDVWCGLEFIFGMEK